MKITAKDAARPWGFTLIELLTVVAIIGVLATLLTSALSSAKRKSRQSVSVGNLRQIALAFNMYRDDQQKRPPTYGAMIRDRYLTLKSLQCAEDRMGDWAGAIESAQVWRSAPAADGTPAPMEERHSYFKSFDLPEDLWDALEKNPLAGIAACQLHGIGRQDQSVAPNLQAFQGLVLRALKDTAVVTRQVFWNSLVANNQPAGPSLSAPASSLVTTALPDMPFFTDDTP